MLVPNAVLDAFRLPFRAISTPAESGLINRSWILRDQAGAPRLVLQWLNTAIFDPKLHDNIEAVTAHLVRKGIETPRLVRTEAGRLYHQDDDGGVWRILTFTGDRTVEKLADAEDAREAGRLVGRFHSALADFQEPLQPIWAAALRSGGTRDRFHDTEAYLSAMADAVPRWPEHRLYREVAELAATIQEDVRSLPTVGALPSRLVHGDLKISNVRFEGKRAVSLIDLDTLGYGTLDAELGDALRSWCNPSAEDSLKPSFDLDLLEAGLAGYAETGSATAAEWASIVPGVQRITLELASRFARDALEECYFGFNPSYGGRGEHNLLRARGQHALARAIRAASPEAERRLARLWA